MKIDLAHVGAALALFLVAYQLGKSKGAKATAAAPGTNVPADAAWWNYAGSWQS